MKEEKHKASIPETGFPGGVPKISNVTPSRKKGEKKRTVRCVNKRKKKVTLPSLGDGGGNFKWRKTFVAICETEVQQTA